MLGGGRVSRRKLQEVRVGRHHSLLEKGRDLARLDVRDAATKDERLVSMDGLRG